jgi:hypothetical protein
VRILALSAQRNESRGFQAPRADACARLDLTTSLLSLDISLLVFGGGLALLLAGGSLLLGRCVSIIGTVGLALLGRGLRRSLGLSGSNHRATRLDVVNIVLELVLELLDDVPACVDVAAAGNGCLLFNESAGAGGMRCEEEQLLISDTYRDLGLDGSFESVLGDPNEVRHLELSARVRL